MPRSVSLARNDSSLSKGEGGGEEKILHLPKLIPPLKILVHQNAKIPLKVISSNPEEVHPTSKTSTEAFWELAEKFPDEIIGWCEEGLLGNLEMDHWEGIFYHNLIMASYAVKTTFLPAGIGYVDELPFINVKRNVSYGTWLMSSDVGGIKGGILLKFRQLFRDEKDFNFLLNSIAKIGQQNGLLCYSEPGLVRSSENATLESRASQYDLFRFVYQHYTTAWTSVLLLCLVVYERSFPLLAYLKSFFHPKIFRRSINLSGLMNPSRKSISTSETIDVIIPTMGRAQYLYDVLKDFSAQTHLPKKIILIEQNADPEAVSELDFIKDEKWPFELAHHFIHRTGACNARNIALEKVTSEYVFFADDDIRFSRNLLKDIISEINKYHLCAVNMNCKQPGEETVFGKIKQWGSFGSGTSFVRSLYAKKCQFSEVFEHGHGEDADFGMQLRKVGCDIIYHPNLEIQHLKAPLGGFRQKPELEWEKECPLPKPSPTVMAYALRNYTPQQIRGYKASLFLKFYPRQKIKNPFSYISSMNKRWEKSKIWAERLIKQGNDF
ncbi:glycosyltransferase family 2 protein [Salinimicrobium sp. GXAS 041]|uniref:glycosyltransferase family 2 protein n=1 Tax=Salinimicrobium sp. GXAS 041 TaxID=3400806 RepID=UPI003C720CFC